jgi:alpha-L-rhamnosidase
VLHTGDSTRSKAPTSSLDFAEASYLSLYGEVKSSWKRTEKGLEYTVNIPPNCTADVVINGFRKTVEAGEHIF